MKNNGWVVKTLVGFLWIVVFTAMTTTISNVIANDKASRQRDTQIKEEFYKTEKENGKKFEHITNQLARNETDVKWMQQTLVEIKELIKNGQ